MNRPRWHSSRLEEMEIAVAETIAAKRKCSTLAATHFKPLTTSMIALQDLFTPIPTKDSVSTIVKAS